MMRFAGVWHIIEMTEWDEDYFNMETQAYINIRSDGLGDFQFGLVAGQIDGEVVKFRGTERFEFSWEGGDECDPASGMGWLQFQDEDTLEGKIKIHLGDSSMLKAKRAKQPIGN